MSTILLVLVTSGGAREAVQADSLETLERFDKLSLERSLCFGWCPVYRVVVHGDGRIEYEGIENVKVIGHRQARLTRRQMAALVDAVNESGYFNLHDNYTIGDEDCPTSWTTDAPWATTSVTVAGRIKKIQHYYGCEEPRRSASDFRFYPLALSNLETRIDEICRTERWVGTEEERKTVIRRKRATPN